MSGAGKKAKMDQTITTKVTPRGTQPEKFTFFWKEDSPFSQFHPSKFQGKPLFITTEDDEKGYTFLFCEQWMMFNKAKLFKDEESAAQILKVTIPIECKKFGRKVKSFDEDVWKQENERIVLEGNRLKFTQNPNLLQELLKTEGTTLVEASPFDKLYGIGLAAKNPKAQDRSTWRGKNLLGELLTRLREELKDEEKSKGAK